MSGLLVPQVLQGLNVIIDGFGHVGVTDSVKLPDLEFDSFTDPSGGMTRSINKGVLKEMVATITIKQLSAIATTAMSQIQQRGTVIFLRGSIQQNGQHLGVVITLNGTITKVTDGTLKTGDEVKRELELKVSTYGLVVNGIPQVMADANNMILVLGGVDVMAQVRAQVIG